METISKQAFYYLLVEGGYINRGDQELSNELYQDRVLRGLVAGRV